MSYQIRDPGPKVSRDVVEGVLAKWPGTFPGQYVDFLVRYNGGKPTPGGFRVEDHREKEFSLRILLGISRRIETSNLQWHKDEIELHDVPEGLAAVGTTDTGDILYMDISKDPGRIYFYDWVGEPGTRLYDLRVDFATFMQGLHE